VHRKSVAPPPGPQGQQNTEAPARLPAVVYLRDRSGADDSPALFEDLARQARLVVIADVRGFGETKLARSVPDARIGYFDPRDGTDADFAYDSFFLGRTLLGMRVEDARAVVRWLRARPDVDSHRIAIIGRGWAGVVTIFAAALEPELSSVAVEGIPASFGDIAQAELYEQPVSLVVPGVLRDFDLVDVLGSLAPRPLLLLNPLDAMTKKMDRALAAHSLRPVHDAYRAAQAQAAFDVQIAPLESDVREALEKWVAQH
jgi:hypothetical protein